MWFGAGIGVLVLGSLGSGSGAGQGKLLPLPCPGPLGMSYKPSEESCHFCWAWRCLGKAKLLRPAVASARQEAWGMPRSDAACLGLMNLRDFRKVCSMSGLGGPAS